MMWTKKLSGDAPSRLSPLKPSNTDLSPLPLRKRGPSLEENKENLGVVRREEKLRPPSDQQTTSAWLERETKFLHPRRMRRSSPSISNSMRTKLIKWLIEVGDVLGLDKEVFFLAVDILDRFLAHEDASTIGGDQFQLVGISALFVASKCESIDFCSIREYAEMTAHAFSSRDLLSMEIRIMTTLGWVLSLPTPIHWLKLMLQPEPRADLPSYSHYKLVQGSKMLTLVLLDGLSIKFRRSLITHAVFSLLTREACLSPLFDNPQTLQCIRYVWGLTRGESFSALGDHIFLGREDSDVHNLVHWDCSLGAKPKRPCSID